MTLTAEKIITENYSELISLVKSTNNYNLLNLVETLSYTSNPQTLGLVNSPASRKFHHNWKGGLVHHYLEMFQIYESLTDIPCSRKSVITCIILHDIHKAYDYYKPFGNEFKYNKLNKTHPVIMNTYLILKFSISLEYNETEAILAAEGGYSEIRVTCQSPLTKLISCLDELSSNVYNGSFLKRKDK